MKNLTREDLKEVKMEIIQELQNFLLPQKQSKSEFLRSSEVKKILGCSDSKLETLRKNGTLSFTKVGGTIYYNNNEISNLFLKQNL